eukprot:6214688-Pleurochrysis_carterae.AAC.2
MIRMADFKRFGEPLNTENIAPLAQGDTEREHARSRWHLLVARATHKGSSLRQAGPLSVCVSSPSRARVSARII